MKVDTFLGLSDDLVFKHAFSNKVILTDFLNSFFQYIKENKRVVKIRVNTDERISGDKRKYKLYYGDIMAYLDKKEVISIEMYKQFGLREFNKSLAYISRKFSNQFRRGKDYQNAKKITSVNIIKTNFYESNDSVINGFSLIDKFDYQITHSTCLEMYLIKLDKIKNIVYNQDKEKRFVRWIRMINAKDMNELKNITKEDEVMENAVRLMEDFLNDEELQDEFDKITDIEYYAEEKGRKAGIEEGHQKLLQTAKNLLMMNMSITDITKATGLSKEEIENVQ